MGSGPGHKNLVPPLQLKVSRRNEHKTSPLFAQNKSLAKPASRRTRLHGVVSLHNTTDTALQNSDVDATHDASVRTQLERMKRLAGPRTNVHLSAFFRVLVLLCVCGRLFRTGACGDVTRVVLSLVRSEFKDGRATLTAGTLSPPDLMHVRRKYNPIFLRKKTKVRICPCPCPCPCPSVDGSHRLAESNGGLLFFCLLHRATELHRSCSFYANALKSSTLCGSQRTKIPHLTCWICSEM